MAPYNMFPPQRHHMVGRKTSHSKMPTSGWGKVVMLIPMHRLVPRLKSRCRDTHFQSRAADGGSQLVRDKPDAAERHFFCDTLSSRNTPLPKSQTDFNELIKRGQAKAYTSRKCTFSCFYICDLGNQTVGFLASGKSLFLEYYIAIYMQSYARL